MAAENRKVLVVFGQNWENYHHGIIRKRHGIEKPLSKHSVRTVLAANQLLQSGAYDTVIFTTGHTNGTNQPAEADAMANLFEAVRGAGTHDVRVLRETVSFDTPGNIHETQKIMQQEGLEGPADAVAPFYHIPRIGITADGLHFPIQEIFPAEKVLGIRRSPTPPWEYILRPLARKDPEGKIPRFIWTRFRTRRQA